MKEDQGFSVRLPREMEKLIKSVAVKEDRSIKAVMCRAIQMYAKRSDKARV